MTITQSSTRLVAFVAGVAVALSLVVGAFAAAPAQAASLTQSQISSIVSLLQSFGADAATIANVQASLNGQPTSGTGGTTGGSSAACPALSRSLQQGSTGADVMALQKFLNGTAATKVSSSGAGSPGLESTYFGAATKAAVMKFQTLNNVSSIGIVGPATRAAITAVCGGTSTGGGTTGGTPTGPGLTIAAGMQPANALAPQGAARVPFTTFTLTNNTGVAQTVTGITVQRIGLGIDSNFSGIVLIDATNNLQIGTAKTLNSNHQATIGDTFTINPGQTMTLTVAGNIASASNVSGQIVSLEVLAVNTSAAVAGSMPIMGASHTINTTLTLGGVSTSSSSYDPAANTTKNIGDTAVRFTGVRFTAGSAEDLKLFSVRWRNTGTASASDISNLMTYVNGTAYPAVLDATGKYYTTVFAGGISITKGNSVDVYVQGDITGSNAASRTVKLDIDKVTDVYFVGQTYGYGVAPTGTYTPWFNGFTTTVNAGTATSISKANEVISQNIAVNVSNQPLGGFVTDFKGEAVSVQQLIMTVSTTTGNTFGITNASIVDENGAVVAGPVDQSGTTLTFTDTITFPVGRHVYTVKGKISSATPNGTTVQLTTIPSSQWSNITGQTSGNSISLSGQGSFSMNTMTVKAAALTVSMSSQPAAANIVAGGTGIIFANIQLDASASGEDVRISAMPIRVSAVTGITGCQLFDGSTVLNTGSNVPTTLVVSGSGTNNFQFDNSLVVTKGTVKGLDLKCNTTSAASGAYFFSLSGSDTISSTGVTSGNSVTVTNSANSASTMTIGSGSVALSVDSSSPSYTLASGGTDGVVLGQLLFRASNEAVTLNKIGLTLTSGSGSSLKNNGAVKVYDGATLLGVATFGSNSVATATLATTVTLPKDTDKILTLKGDVSDIGSGQSGTDGALVKVDPNSSEGSGQSSGNTLYSGASGAVQGVRTYNTFPTVALDTLSSSGVNDGILMHFKVTANSADKVGIGQFKFKIASSSGVTVTNVQLFAFTSANGSTYSSPVTTGTDSSGQVGNTVSNITTGTAFTVAPNTAAVQVAPGTTVYFELKASLSGVVSGSSVVTTLQGDSSGTPTTGTTVFASVSGNFVWSPNATTTAATSTGNDWTNGFGVSGLPSGGLIQTRSQ